MRRTSIAILLAGGLALATSVSAQESPRTSAPAHAEICLTNACGPALSAPAAGRRASEPRPMFERVFERSDITSEEIAALLREEAERFGSDHLREFAALEATGSFGVRSDPATGQPAEIVWRGPEGRMRVLSPGQR